MKTLHDLIYQAGGYSFDDLKKSSGPERRQILQLGCAVIFSTVASIINWNIATAYLLKEQFDGAMIIIPIFTTSLVVLFVSLSINRSLIFYSDVHAEKKASYVYSAENKETMHTLPFVRLALVVIVCGINITVLEITRAELWLIGLLGIFELYPLFLKKQIGQTITGGRIQKKLLFQRQRSELKDKEYEVRISKTEEKLQAADDLDNGSNPDDSGDPNNTPDPVKGQQLDVEDEGRLEKQSCGKVRLVKK